jgi:hypothetical protein
VTSPIIEVDFEPSVSSKALSQLDPVRNNIDANPEEQKSFKSESLGSDESGLQNEQLDTLNFSFEPVKVSGAAETTTLRPPSEAGTETGMDMDFE